MSAGAALPLSAFTCLLTASYSAFRAARSVFRCSVTVAARLFSFSLMSETETPNRSDSSSSSSWALRLEFLDRLGVDVGDVLQRLRPRPFVDLCDQVGREVEHPLQVARRDVEQQPEPARRALHVPDVGDRRGQLDVAHALAPDLRARDLDAALVADGAGVADPLVLAAVALPVLGRTEDALAEETAVLRLERAVVDRLRLGDLAVRPRPDRLRRGQADADRVEVVDVEHATAVLPVAARIPARRYRYRHRTIERGRFAERESAMVLRASPWFRQLRALAQLSTRSARSAIARCAAER